MKVKVGQAVKMFFGNSSFEMVYFEAISNAIDANATEIEISIFADSYSEPNSLIVEISDNGEGFTDDRYKKFSNLFDVEESSHKGLGRLVYLFYFNKIEITSRYDGGKQRNFVFSEDFEANNFEVVDVGSLKSGTDLVMTGYQLQRIHKNEFLKPNYLKNRILEEFYSKLFQLKKNGIQIRISITSTIGDSTDEIELNINDIPDLETVELESQINLFDKFYLHYSIKECDPSQDSFVAAISVDNRTIKADVIAPEYIPTGYSMVFLLFSDYFVGKVDASRQALTISKLDQKNILQIFRKKIGEIVEAHIPRIRERNEVIYSGLVNRYPHLSDYFESEEIGYVNRTDVLSKAQERFFRTKRELLEAETLTEEQFEKSIEVSSRALMEYILFRQVTINKLKEITPENSEAELHRLFASMRSEGKFDGGAVVQDLYRNNAWLLDDKYMTYETVLSDREIGELISFITEGEEEKDADRPDLAFVFSSNPTEGHPFDIVIVEFKKRGASADENLAVEFQLKKRARKLMQFYDNQIQRIWYYGIIEITREVELGLVGSYTELYSSGKMYYKEDMVGISLNPTIKVPISLYIWDLDAVISDADSRNSAFLKLVKSKFVKDVEKTVM